MNDEDDLTLKVQVVMLPFIRSGNLEISRFEIKEVIQWLLKDQRCFD